jgi:hypothetical protein
LNIEIVFDFSSRVRKKHYVKKKFEKWIVCWFLFNVNNFSSSRFFHSHFSFQRFFSLFINFVFLYIMRFMQHNQRESLRIYQSWDLKRIIDLIIKCVVRQTISIFLETRYVRNKMKSKWFFIEHSSFHRFRFSWYFVWKKNTKNEENEFFDSSRSLIKLDVNWCISIVKRLISFNRQDR